MAAASPTDRSAAVPAACSPGQDSLEEVDSVANELQAAMVSGELDSFFEGEQQEHGPGLFESIEGQQAWDDGSTCTCSCMQ